MRSGTQSFCVSSSSNNSSGGLVFCLVFKADLVSCAAVHVTKLGTGFLGCFLYPVIAHMQFSSTFKILADCSLGLKPYTGLSLNMEYLIESCQTRALKRTWNSCEWFKIQYDIF